MLVSGAAADSSKSRAAPVEGTWRVVGFLLTNRVGAWSTEDALRMIGKTQRFDRLAASGDLLVCKRDFDSEWTFLTDEQARRDTERDLGELIRDFEFPLNGTGVFINMLACAGLEYPILQLGDRSRTFYVSDGAAFQLKKVGSRTPGK
jgi:hypothetical protein